jgi:putative NADH-flavin reductase
VPPAGARLLIVGGAATLTVPGAGGGTVVDAPDFPAVLRPIALACAEQLAVCRAAGPGVDWTYLSPPALLEPGERTAVALLDEAERPAHHRTRFTVAW